MQERRRVAIRRTLAAGLVAASLPFALGSSVRPAAASSGGATAPSARPLFPLPAPPVQPQPCPPPPLRPGPPPPPLGPPKVPERAIPIAHAPPPRHVDLAPLEGKGIWLTIGPGTQLDVAALIALARGAGLHQLWVRTGSSTDGYYGDGVLGQLIPAAHAAGIDVIAWDFPTLSDPALDARRAAAALRAGVDGFGADIETASEGTYLTARRVAYYLSLVRAAAGAVPVVAIVYRPTSYWLTAYPYAAEAPFVDAYAPMVYWSCNEPGATVAASIAALRRLRPVAPIGQDYDMAAEGGRHGLPSGREIWRFLDAARRAGAIGASLYDLESGGRPQLTALGAYDWPG